MQWKTPVLMGGSIALTCAALGTQSAWLAGAGLAFSAASWYFIPKPPTKEELLVLYKKQQLDKRTKLLEDLAHKLDKDQKQLLGLQSHIEQQQQELEQKKKEIVAASNELEASKQKIYEALLNQAKIQANQYVMALFKQQWEQLQQQQATLNAVLPELAQQWEQRFIQAREQDNQQLQGFVEQCNQQVTQARKKVAEAGQFYQQIYAQATQNLATELHQLKQPLFPPPDCYDDYPRSSVVSERCLKFLYDKGIYLDFVDCYEDNESISLLLKPKKGVVDFVECYANVGKQLPALQALAHGTNAAPDYRIYQGSFRIDFDMSGLTKEQRLSKTRSKEIEELPPNWLEDIVRNCYHFRVNGQTRAGKSTFVNNLLGLMRRMFNNRVEVVLIDPKYPLSKWSIKPQYKGTEEAILGLKAMADEVDRRLKLATEDADAGKPIRDFEPILYILDEVDTVAAEYNDPVPPVAEFLQSLELSTKKAAATLLKKGLKVGAALKVMVCYIGQSPLCSTIGMNKNDFNHSANFFLGENIMAAIEEVAFKHQQPYLKQQYRLRQERAEQYLGTPEEALYKYFALVKAPGMSAKLVTLPLQDTYDFVPGEVEDEDDDDDEQTYSIAPANWNEAEPEALVASARLHIVGLIKEGVTNPLDICRAIWGPQVNPQARPYNGKFGVKRRIEYLIQQHQENG